MYNNELAEWSDQKFEVVKFDDQQIQRFLGAWATEMPLGKSVAHLIATLDERPRVLELARNPLLLTIIAWLYSDTPFVVPHSRTELYREVTTQLLDEWNQHHHERSPDSEKHKREILQALALFFQERASTVQTDKESAALAEVLKVVKEVLLSLDLEAKHAEPLLKEIVDRSGLVLALERGMRFQFSHRTIQEFFAAMALERDAHTLVQRFQEDPDTWRETVKLWCGLEHDSTALIQAVEAVDPVTALECLGEAQQVEAQYATALIEGFLGRLGTQGADEEPVIRALALVAADTRLRGQQLREALCRRTADPAELPAARHAAAKVLASTHHPEAAEALVRQADREPWLRPYLLGMGDLAALPLSRWASAGDEWALEALASIGTPKAVCALAGFLWGRAPGAERRAAWHLAGLLPQPGVESVLRAMPLSPEQRKAEHLEWIWEPFEPDPGSPLRVVAGRVAALLKNTQPHELPAALQTAVDPRLAIPLCTVVAQKAELNFLKASSSEDLKKLRSKFDDVFYHRDVEGVEPAQQEIRYYAQQLSSHQTWLYLFNKLSRIHQERVVRRLLQGYPRPSKEDWQRLDRPIRYKFEPSLQATGFRACVLVLGLLVLAGLIRDMIFLEPFIETIVLMLLVGGYCIYEVLEVIPGYAARARRTAGYLGIFMIFGSPGILVAFHLLGPSFLSPTGWSAIVGVFLGGFLGALVESKFKPSLLCAALGGASLALGAEVGLGAVELASGPLILPLDGSGSTIDMCFPASFVAFVSAITVARYAFIGSWGKVNFISIIFAPLLLGLVIGAILSIGSCVLLPAVLYPTVVLYDIWGWPGVSGFWIAWLAISFSFLLWGARQERRAENPLHDILDEFRPTAPDVPLAYPWKLLAAWRFLLPQRSGSKGGKRGRALRSSPSRPSH
ncbi:MAG: hypothetical protein HC897_11745 [Thermoanaerobaculia bacterium]|nr:hypothetical protein [Thermoanaerobaculia bacterium]